MAETVAEGLMNQTAVTGLNEYVQECERLGQIPTEQGYYDHMVAYVIQHPDYLEMTPNENQETRRRIADIAKIVGASGAFLAGLNPDMGYRAADNAIENNFMLILYDRNNDELLNNSAEWFAEYLRKAKEEAEQYSFSEVAETVLDGAIALANNRIPGSGPILKAGKSCLKQGVKAVKKVVSGKTGDAVKSAASKRNAGKRVRFAEPEKQVGAQKVVVGNNTNTGLARETNASTRKISDRTSKPLMGEYKQVRGHHVHAKKAFEGHVNYDPKKGFPISNEYMKSNNIKHDRVTVAQMRLFRELKSSGRPNTLKEHTRIAVEALIEGGSAPVQARNLVAQSLKDLKNKGVTIPTIIPWGKK